MNIKETLKRLHEIFPEFDTDTLLKILDCYIEESITLPKTINAPWNGPIIKSSDKPWENIVYALFKADAVKGY